MKNNGKKIIITLLIILLFSMLTVFDKIYAKYIINRSFTLNVKSAPFDVVVPAQTIEIYNLDVNNFQIPITNNNTYQISGTIKFNNNKVAEFEVPPKDTKTLDLMIDNKIVSGMTKEGEYDLLINVEAPYSTVIKNVKINLHVSTSVGIGDYVDYKPDTVTTNYMGLGTSTIASQNPSGSASNPGDGIQQENLKWRVLSVNENGTVDIVSAKPTTKEVYFMDAIGFNNAVYLLNDLCAKQYSNTTFGVTARSINLEDIESAMSSNGISDRNKYVHPREGTSYGEIYEYTLGNPVNTIMPAIYKHVGTTGEEDSRAYYTSPTTETTTTENILNVKSKYYAYDPTKGSFSSNFINLMFPKSDTSYWVATRCITALHNGANYCICYNSKGWNGAYDLINSFGNKSNRMCYVRPVVTLDLNVVEIGKYNGKTEDSPRTLTKK